MAPIWGFPYFQWEQKSCSTCWLDILKWLDNWEWWIFPMKWSKKKDLKMVQCGCMLLRLMAKALLCNAQADELLQISHRFSTLWNGRMQSIDGGIQILISDPIWQSNPEKTSGEMVWDDGAGVCLGFKRSKKWPTVFQTYTTGENGKNTNDWMAGCDDVPTSSGQFAWWRGSPVTNCISAIKSVLPLIRRISDI